MGQYYLTVNLDKQQFIYPHKFGDGLKLVEFGASGDGTMFGLAVLLADGNGRGGGDLRSDDPIIGSWSGDRIVVAGDYADGGKWLTEKQIQQFYDNNPDEKPRHAEHDMTVGLYQYANDCFEDISVKVIQAIMEGDEYFAEHFVKVLTGHRRDLFTEDELARLEGI